MKYELLRKTIMYDKSPLLVRSDPDENWLNDWTPMSGEWKQEDGFLIGIEPGNKGGILFSKQYFTQNVMMRFKISTVLPATRDLNAVFCAKWNTDIDYLGESYVCGLNGWYDNKSGIERNGGFYTSTTLYQYTPGTEVEMLVGAIDGHCFMFVDGKLITEYLDEKPLTEGHIGFSAYCTILKIRDIEIREIVWESKQQSYTPEFTLN